MPATAECIPTLPGLSPVGGKRIVARFDGAHLSSDGGLLALREVERRVGIGQRLAACICDPRTPERVRHGLDEIIRFRMLMIAAGWHLRPIGRWRILNQSVTMPRKDRQQFPAA